MCAIVLDEIVKPIKCIIQHFCLILKVVYPSIKENFVNNDYGLCNSDLSGLMTNSVEVIMCDRPVNKEI